MDTRTLTSDTYVQGAHLKPESLSAYCDVMPLEVLIKKHGFHPASMPHWLSVDL